MILKFLVTQLMFKPITCYNKTSVCLKHKLFEKSQNGNLEDKQLFVSACNFIGLLNQDQDEWANFKKIKSDVSVEFIEAKIKERNEARDHKNYQLADQIRDELLEKGVQIEDKDGKTSWKFK